MRRHHPHKPDGGIHKGSLFDNQPRHVFRGKRRRQIHVPGKQRDPGIHLVCNLLITGHILSPRTLEAAAEQSLQCLPHAFRTLEALRRIVSAGLQNDFSQTSLCMGRSRQRLPGKPPGQSLLPVCRSDGRRGGRTERHTAAIQQTVKRKPQRIDIGCMIIPATLMDFGSHIGKCACSAGISVSCSSRKISQLIPASPGEIDILWFDIPVDEMMLPAHFQRPADIDSGLYNISGSKSRIFPVLRQRCQQIHFDPNLPARILPTTHDLMLSIPNNMAAALQLVHQGKLILKRLQQPVIRRQGHYLQHCPADGAGFLFLCFIYLTENSFCNQTGGFPGTRRLCIFVFPE